MSIPACIYSAYKVSTFLKWPYLFTEQDRDIIIQAKKSILYNGETAWVKKGESLFDVTMGSFDGAESCELIGLYMLSQLTHLDINIGLYRDDGLSVMGSQ